MIHNFSYNDPQVRQEVNEKIGRPFPFFERIKMGGIGSQRLVIINASKNILNHLEKNNHIRYSNIELRKGGIIIGFTSRLDGYGLVIGYKELKVSRTGHKLRLESDFDFVVLEPLNNDVLDLKFVEKLLRLQKPFTNV